MGEKVTSRKSDILILSYNSSPVVDISVVNRILTLHAAAVVATPNQLNDTF